MINDLAHGTGRAEFHRFIILFDDDGVDCAIRYGLGQYPGLVVEKILTESVVPVCSPALLEDPARPLRVPADLRHHVMLHLENATGGAPWVDWTTWFRAMGIAEIKPAGMLRFSRYDEVIAAAVAGQGVAPGGFPLIKHLLKEKRLVAPFKGSSASPRGYYLVESPAARSNAAARDFAAWMIKAAKDAKL